jgi:hypothetical protein
MVGGPTKRLLSVPVPATVRRLPMPVGIGPPIRVVLGYLGLKNVAVVFCKDPVSICRELVIEDIVGVVGISLIGDRGFFVYSGGVECGSYAVMECGRNGVLG